MLCRFCFQEYPNWAKGCPVCELDPADILDNSEDWLEEEEEEDVNDL